MIAEMIICLLMLVVVGLVLYAIFLFFYNSFMYYFLNKMNDKIDNINLFLDRFGYVMYNTKEDNDVVTWSISEKRWQNRYGLNSFKMYMLLKKCRNGEMSVSDLYRRCQICNNKHVRKDKIKTTMFNI